MGQLQPIANTWQDMNKAEDITLGRSLRRKNRSKSKRNNTLRKSFGKFGAIMVLGEKNSRKPMTLTAFGKGIAIYQGLAKISQRITKEINDKDKSYTKIPEKS